MRGIELIRIRSRGGMLGSILLLGGVVLVINFHRS